jgi:hypothetical protein
MIAYLKYMMRWILALLFYPTFLVAELKLDSEFVDVKPAPTDEQIKVKFSFKNVGTKPVKIIDIQSTCACLSANLDKRVYEPGAEGKGDAEFRVSQFVGKHEKSITVTTDDPAQPEWIVPFILVVPAIVSIEPTNVQWWIGEEPTEKKTTVRFDKSYPMQITKVSSTRENVTWRINEVEPNQHYEIWIKPTGTQDITIGALKVETDSKIPKYARQMAFFSIVNQPKSRMDEPTAGGAKKVPAP